MAINEDLIEPDPIHYDLLPIWNAWHDLSSSRQSGMAPVGLPWSEMSAYCQDNGIHGQQRMRWIRLMRAMDSTWLVEQGKSAQQRREQRERERRNRNGESGSRD